jgi:hypothetical protein
MICNGQFNQSHGMNNFAADILLTSKFWNRSEDNLCCKHTVISSCDLREKGVSNSSTDGPHG